ncbi:MAG: methyltransferase family protein [Candidatus Brocadiales bacterium]
MSISKWIYHFRGILVSLPLIFAVACFYGETENDILTWPLGGMIFFFGLLLRTWARRHCAYLQKGYKHLATTGPYSFVRNPLYIGNTLMCLGATILSELLWLVPFTLFYCACLYSFVVRHEEARLLVRYGESYRRYMSEIPRWFPDVVSFKSIRLIYEYLRTSLVPEASCMLILLPYIFKELLEPVLEPWFRH